MNARRFALVLPLLMTAFLVAIPRTAESQERRFRAAAAQGNEQRFALVVGNRDYPQGALVTPENDANDVAAALRKLGFEVVLANNLDPTRFRSTVRRFEDLLATADGRVIALVFYAGHGVQIQGKNYLLPAHVKYKDQRDILDFGIEADQLLARINAQDPEVTIMILDACRDSPLPPVVRSARAASGLARMDPPAGTFLAFATSPGSTASDNYRERNGLFTKFLLEHLSTPGLNTEQLFRRVRTDVYRASRGQQLPEDSNRLVGGDFFFKALPASVEARSAAAPSLSPATTKPPAAQSESAAKRLESPSRPERPPQVALAVPAPLVAKEGAMTGLAPAPGSLRETLESNRHTVVYSYENGLGKRSDFEGRVRSAAGVLLELPEGGVLTLDHGLHIYAGVIFDPPIPLAKAPLAVGMKWKHSGHFREVTGIAEGVVSSSFEVVGKEDLATAAGAFSTYRTREVRWIAGTRYTIERWLDAESLIPVRERNDTFRGSNNLRGYGYFVAPLIKSNIEIKRFGLQPREAANAAR